jgi:hypothetical protein
MTNVNEMIFKNIIKSLKTNIINEKKLLDNRTIMGVYRNPK